MLYEGAGAAHDVRELRLLLEDTFAEWGPVESVHVVPSKTIAFVTYAWRSSAEFAKEATHLQGLKGSRSGEVLTVRWANEDPNPAAAAQRKRGYEVAFAAAAGAAWAALPEEQKQARMMQLQLAAALRSKRQVSEYPDTDWQYAAADEATAATSTGGVTAYPNTDYAQYDDVATAAYNHTAAAAAAVTASHQCSHRQQPAQPSYQGYDACGTVGIPAKREVRGGTPAENASALLVAGATQARAETAYRAAGAQQPVADDPDCEAPPSDALGLLGACYGSDADSD